MEVVDYTFKTTKFTSHIVFIGRCGKDWFPNASDSSFIPDNRFYQRLDADPIQQDQKIVKDTISDMITSCELPPTAKHLVVTTPRTSCLYVTQDSQTEQLWESHCLCMLLPNREHVSIPWCRMDVESLNTVIPNYVRLQALAYFLDQRTLLHTPWFAWQSWYWPSTPFPFMPNTTAKLVELPWAVEWGPITHVRLSDT